MKFKLIILFLILSTSCYSQDSLNIDTANKTVETTIPSKIQKKKKKKRIVSSSNIHKVNPGRLTKKENDNSISPLLFTGIIITVSIIAIFIAKRLTIGRDSRKPYNYFKNEYIKSLGWTEDRENNPKRDALLRQLDSLSDRQAYYRYQYLQSDEWKRKRHVVLKRDNWKCVYCGGTANQVHHKRYAKLNIGSEPIDWLVSVCKNCHDRLHD
jgi:hypothetical protein